MFKLTILACFLARTFAADQIPFEVVYEWNYMNYNWPSTDALVQALVSGVYIPENIAIGGIKLWKDKLYLTMARWKSGVPVSLAVTSATPINGITNPLLDPFPNWDMQTEGDCTAFQYVQSMEIDLLGRMWVLDTGRTETLSEKPAIRCPPRLVILDLENKGSILRTYVFPDEVASHETVLLDDINIDHEDGGMAYITDESMDDPGIIVYSLKNNTSWKVRDNDSMKAQEEAIKFEVGGILQSGAINLDSMALAPPGPNRLLYYAPMSSFHLYTIPVSFLKNPSMGNVAEYVKDLGRKNYQSDGIIMSNKGILYLGNLADASIFTWNSEDSKSFTNDLKQVFRDPARGQYPAEFGFDECGYLWYTSNFLPNFKADNIDITKPNYRVFRALVQQKSYQYLKNGNAPESPVIIGPTSRGSNFKHCVLLRRD